MRLSLHTLRAGAVGFVVGVMLVGGGAVGAAVYDAKNADHVDGLSAVKAGAGKNARAGKLIAANGKRKLPVTALPQETLIGVARGVNPTTFTTSTPTLLPGSQVVVTMARRGYLVITFSSQTACGSDGAGILQCAVNVLVDGDPATGEGNDVFDSSDVSNESINAIESRSITRVVKVPAGKHTVTLAGYAYGGAAGVHFDLSYWTLLVEAHM
jgi:hypothetical protein